MDKKRGRVVHVKCVLSIGSISISSSSISRNITMRAFLKAQRLAFDTTKALLALRRTRERAFRFISPA